MKSLFHLVILLSATYGTIQASVEGKCNEDDQLNTVQNLMRNMVLDNCLKLAADYQKPNITAAISNDKCVPEFGSFAKPADSCEQLVKLKPNNVPGYNWIKNSTEEAVLVYCTAKTQCCRNDNAGWVRAALLDMTDPHQTCPQGFRQINSPVRACGRTTTSAGCNSMTFKTNGLSYNKVCGRVIGYHFGSPSAFYSSRVSPSVDGYYLEGVSITHGRNHRKHIWSFANALLDQYRGDAGVHVCPCTYPGRSTYPVPNFVGNDYFCDSGSRTWGQIGSLYTNDPLWDGHGCEDQSACCSFNTPPWFCKQLPSPTTDDIELRICADEGWQNEDSPVELVELYIK